jgi:hypothetical protein
MVVSPNAFAALLLAVSTHSSAVIFVHVPSDVLPMVALVGTAAYKPTRVVGSAEPTLPSKQSPAFKTTHIPVVVF